MEALEPVREFGLGARAVLSSFRPAALAELGGTGAERGLIGEVPSPELFEHATRIGSSMVMSHHVPYGLGWFIEQAHSRGLRAGIWELVSTETGIEDALSFDIEVLSTNRPDIALEELGR